MDVPALKVRFVVVNMFHRVEDTVGDPDSVHVPFPMLSVRVPVPDALNGVVADVSVMLLLLALKSRTHPAVAALHAPIVKETIVGLVLTVMVQVTPPTQVAASNVTVSALPGTEAPVAPPVVADHMAVLEPSQVHVTVQTAKREAASAQVPPSRSASATIRYRSMFIAAPIAHVQQEE